MTETLLKRLNKSGKVHMVPASLKGKYVIRFTVTSQYTTDQDIERDWKIISDTATKVSLNTKIKIISLNFTTLTLYLHLFFDRKQFKLVQLSIWLHAYYSRLYTTCTSFVSLFIVTINIVLDRIIQYK